jgi:fucose permease
MPTGSRRLVLVIFLLFIALGLAHSVLGPAWPAMRSDFSRPLGDLGVLIAVTASAYFVAGLVAGASTRRFGVGDVVIFALGLCAASALLYAVANGWLGLLVASVGIGFGGGLIDSLLNAYVALKHDARTMNLLHASFGIGATAAPLVVAGFLAGEMTWRAPFVFLMAVELVLLVVGVVVRRGWQTGTSSPADESHEFKTGGVVLGLLGVFVLYVGVEVSAGQWSYSVLTEGRGVGEFAAGLWVAAYWGGLTGGRLMLGILGGRVDAQRVLRTSMVGSLVGAILFWWNPSGLGLVGLPLLGVSFAGIFPTLVALTPAWVGAERTPSVVGQQIAAATVGAAAFPWLAGRWMEASGLERLGPFLLATALAMTALHYVVDRTANGSRSTSLGTAQPTDKPGINPRN